jgi:enolase
MKNFKIKNITSREILDSRGVPTVEATVVLEDGTIGISMVPSGASTGAYEAIELRDNDKSRYFGKGVLTAVNNVNTQIYELLEGKDASDQKMIDKLMLGLDGTPNKANLGANAILAVSMASARAVANKKGIPLYEYLNSLTGAKMVLPTPMCNIMNGGAHASNTIDIQEFMVMPVGAKTFSEGLRWCSEIFNSLKGLLKTRGLSIAVGDEGGFAPNLNSAEEALDIITLAIEKAGYNTDQVKLALDAAVSEWQTDVVGKYMLPKTQIKFNAGEIVYYWTNLLKKYPIISLEDPMGEEDYATWTKLTKNVAGQHQIVGDDLFVTNPIRLKKGIKEKQANSILIKLNQIGSLTETLETIKNAQDAGFTTVISHRSGETEDTFIADLAVATGSTQIKTGSLSRSERVAKYNRLLKIEQELDGKAVFAGRDAFYNLK